MDNAAAQNTDSPANEAPAEGADVAMSWLTETMNGWLYWLPETAWVQTLAGLALLLLLAALFHFIARSVVLRTVKLAMSRLPGWWFREAIESKTLSRLVPLVPILVIAEGISLVPHLPAGLVELITRVMYALAVLMVALALGAALNLIHTIYNRYPIAQGRPIKGYVQVAKLLLYLAAGILVVSALMAESPWVFLTGLGAMTAVLMLVFRDTILSLVAGIQLVNYDLIRVGDWIEMPQFNADGDVIDISLNVVQVRNWDKTVTSIPTHKFLENSFKNWRGMFEVGGRRISRSIHIDMTTVRFLTGDEVERFGRFRLLSDYIDGKVKELEEYNREHHAEADAEILANARHLTNLGTFRAYILAYLMNHPLVHQEFTTLVRQQPPGEHGLPLQIWTHLKDTRWVHYENAQSDIFDHIVAVAPEFGLRIFQNPTGYDLAQLRQPETEAGSCSESRPG